MGRGVLARLANPGREFRFQLARALLLAFGVAGFTTLVAGREYIGGALWTAVGAAITVQWMLLARAMRRARTEIILPPGHIVGLILRWFYSPKTMSMVFNQLFIDWANEWKEAHLSGRRSEMIRASLQGYRSILWAMWERGLGRFLGVLWKAYRGDDDK
jgi:hypothetical protein